MSNLTTVNASYFGQPLAAPAGGQLLANNNQGPLARTLWGQATLVGNNSSGAAGVINYIDGVQSFGKTFVLNVQSVTAPATINGTANTAIYSSTGADSQVKIGDSVVIAGFANSGNNGTFTVIYVTSTGVWVVNSSSVAETNPAATLSDTQNGTPIAIYVTWGGGTNAVLAVGVTSISATGFTVTFESALTNTDTATINFILIFPGV